LTNSIPLESPYYLTSCPIAFLSRVRTILLVDTVNYVATVKGLSPRLKASVQCSSLTMNSVTTLMASHTTLKDLSPRLKTTELTSKPRPVASTTPPTQWSTRPKVGTVRVFRQKFTLEDAIGSHACSLEALTCVRPMAFLSEVHCSYRCHHELRRNTEGRLTPGTTFLPPSLNKILSTRTSFHSNLALKRGRCQA
jgi:hypothetical protein